MKQFKNHQNDQNHEDLRETSVVNQLKQQTSSWPVVMSRSHHWTLWSMVEDCKHIAQVICAECGGGWVHGVHRQNQISIFADVETPLKW